jgi:hypothetical protein
VIDGGQRNTDKTSRKEGRKEGLRLEVGGLRFEV